MMLAQILNSRGFAACVHGGLWLLLYLGATRLGGDSPDFRETEGSTSPAHTLAPVAKLENLFTPATWPATLGATNTLNAFATLHFMPRTTSTPPATTRKVALTYQGFYETGPGPRQAMIRLGDDLIVTAVGQRITTNFFVAEATVRSLTLTNLAAETNVLSLNAKKDVEVPIR